MMDGQGLFSLRAHQMLLQNILLLSASTHQISQVIQAILECNVNQLNLANPAAVSLY